MNLSRLLCLSITSCLAVMLALESLAEAKASSYVVGVRQHNSEREFQSFQCSFSSKCRAELYTELGQGKVVNLSLDIYSDGREVHFKFSSGLIGLIHAFSEAEESSAVNDDFLRLDKLGHARGVVELSYERDNLYPLDPSANANLRALLQAPVLKLSGKPISRLDIVISTIP